MWRPAYRSTEVELDPVIAAWLLPKRDEHPVENLFQGMNKKRSNMMTDGK
jgi:hypothetical protein